MTDALVIEVPLPPRELSANAREFWAREASVKAAYKREIGKAALAARVSTGWSAPARARISLHYCTKGSKLAGLYAPRDWDNAVAVFKTAQDALVEEGILIGDASRVLEGGSVTFNNKTGPWVQVTIERLS